MNSACSGCLRQPTSAPRAVLTQSSVTKGALQASHVLPALSRRSKELASARAHPGLALINLHTEPPSPSRKPSTGLARASAFPEGVPTGKEASGSTRAAIDGPIPIPRPSEGAQGASSTKSLNPRSTPSSGEAETPTREEAEVAGGTALRASDTPGAPAAPRPTPATSPSTATATASAPAQAQAPAFDLEEAAESATPIPAPAPSLPAQRQPLAPLAALARRSQRALLPPLESRPGVVRRSFEEGLPVAHFAFGSNLSLEKLTSRVPGMLHPLSYEPAVVRAHRLAFNLAGLGLVEPTMASIEPCSGAHPGDQGSEVHGLLVTLLPEEYDALYVSEGGAAGPFRAYLEYKVTAVTYSGVQYQAIAFRANPESRSTLPRNREQLPSRRYLNLIISGAKERGLDEAYVRSLERKLARMRDPWNLLA